MNKRTMAYECTGLHMQEQGLLFSNPARACRHPALPGTLPALLPIGCRQGSRHTAAHSLTHLLTVILCKLIQQPRPLLPSEVSQEGGQDGADMF